VTTASADCWRHANQRARPVISLNRKIGTGIIDRSANMKLKSGSLASPLADARSAAANEKFTGRVSAPVK